MDEIHYHFHFHDDPVATKLLRQVLDTQATHSNLLRKVMANSTLSIELANEINEVTNKIADAVGKVVENDAAEDAAYTAEIKRLNEKVAAGEAVTAADLEGFKTLEAKSGSTKSVLTAIQSALEGMGSSPGEPLPPVELPPVPDPVVVPEVE